MPGHYLLKRTWPIICTIWALDTFLTSFQVYMQGIYYSRAFTLAITGSAFSCLCASLLSYILLPRLIRQQRMLLFIILSVILCLMVSCVIVYFSLPLLCNSYRELLITPPACNFMSMVPGYFISVLFTSGTICGFRFYQEYANTAIDHEQLRVTHLEAELTLLRGQLNPHFVFNMMNGIHVLIQRDARQAAGMVLEFSDMLRFQLYDCSQPFISLQQEINYLQHYVSVEHKRRGDEIKVDCYWGDGLPSCYISPLLLTPFVENAFKHVASAAGKSNFIRISLYMEHQHLFFTVDNSKECMPSIPDPLRRPKGIGLVNVKKRLSLLYPDRHLLQIKETADRFAVFLEIDTSPQYPNSIIEQDGN